MEAQEKREQPSAYFVDDRSNPEEVTRLELQDRMLTTGMGGVLSEQTDPTTLQRLLDVGCGTGGWLFETARTYPTIETLVGVDISGKMLAYTRTQAKAQGLDQRVEFRRMDALCILDFPPRFFDLVNHRLGLSWVRKWEWAKLLSEYQRVTRTDGIIRITEAAIVESNSPALTALCDIIIEACYQSGRFSTPSGDAVIHELAPLLTQHGIRNVQTQVHVLTYRAGTVEHQCFSKDMEHFFRVASPFLHKWAHVPSDYEKIYQQALKEMQQLGFVATWKLITAWGVK